MMARKLAWGEGSWRLAILTTPALIGLVLWRNASAPTDSVAEVRDRIGMRSASPVLEQLRRDHPHDAEVSFLSARQARLEGRSEEAVTYLEQARTLGWPDWQIERERALQLARTDFPRTRPTLEHFLLDNPVDSEVLLALAEGELQAGHRDLAAKLASRVLEESPNNVCALALRGEARLQNRRLDLARADLEAALAAGPDSLSFTPARACSGPLSARPWPVQASDGTLSGRSR